MFLEIMLFSPLLLTIFFHIAFVYRYPVATENLKENWKKNALRGLSLWQDILLSFFVFSFSERQTDRRFEPDGFILCLLS